MKKKRFNPLKQVANVALAAIFVLSAGTEARAITFKDVPANHWAYSHISSVADQGLMIGDFEGAFSPDDYIDKFDASILIARIVGYNDSGTLEELAEYDRIYNKWRLVIEGSSSTFKRWKTYADKHIAYLLEQQILTEADLKEFVVLRDKEERLRALTREEMAIMLVRALGKESAIHEVVGKAFSDDTSITKETKPYIYYLQAMSIIEGDKNNNYNPKEAIQRSAMAKVVDLAYKALQKKDNEDISATGHYQSISGEIAQVYSGMNAIQISSDMVRYHGSIKTMAPNVTIKVDSVLSSFRALEPGMYFTGVIDVNKDEIVSLSIESGKEIISKEKEKEKEKEVDTTTTEEIPKELYIVEGTVDSTRTEDLKEWVVVNIKMLNARGDIVEEKREFRVAKGASIYRGQDTELFSKIKKSDSIRASYKENVVYKIQLEKEIDTFKGKIVEKKVANSRNIVVIEEKETKNQMEYQVTSQSNIYRNGRKYGTFADLRVGDEVEVETLYGDIDQMKAEGYRSTEDVVIQSIFHSADEAYIIGKTDKGDVKKFPMAQMSANDYSELRVGATVRLYLDSDEVESFAVLKDSSKNAYTGTIDTLSRNTIALKEENSTQTREFTYDNNTTVVDGKTGRTVTISYLERDMKVYLVTNSNNGKYAAVITILD